MHRIASDGMRETESEGKGKKEVKRKWNEEEK